MFDIGWGEFFLIGVVALIVVGPKELPGLMRTVGQYAGKARMMAREFQRTLEQAANESGMNEVTQTLRGLDQLNPGSPVDMARKYAANTPASAEKAGPQPDAAPASASVLHQEAATPPAQQGTVVHPNVAGAGAAGVGTEAPAPSQAAAPSPEPGPETGKSAAS